MISLRQHAISLAAVFLALAVGVVLGSGTLSDGLLSGLRNDKTDLQHQVDQLNTDNNQLNDRINAGAGFDQAVAGRIVKGALDQRPVIIFTTPDAKPSDVDAVTDLVNSSGGRVSGRVGLNDQFVDANQAEKLRSVVTAAIPAGATLRTDSVDQGTLAGDLLGLVLLLNAQNSQPQATDPQRDAALQALRDSGFISYEDGKVSAGQLGLVVTGGSLPADSGNKGSTVARFAAALDARGAGVVLAGERGSAVGNASIAVARSDAASTAILSTVDNVDDVSGRITTVLALQEQLAGKAGRYGTGPGAMSLTVGQ